MVEYTQNHLGAAQVLFKHCVLYVSLSLGSRRVLTQLESRTQITDRRIESVEGDMRAMMGLLQTFIGSPQMSSVSSEFMYLVDATHKKIPVPMNMASSFDVRFYA